MGHCCHAGWEATLVLFLFVGLAPPGADPAGAAATIGASRNTVSPRSTLPFKRARKSELFIQTSTGMVRGTREKAANGKDVNIWWGIPYAEPPLGALRFKRPVPIKPWQGVKDAVVRPNACVQLRSEYYPGFFGEEQWNPNTKISEDCLYLNIAVPANLPFNHTADVMVWIYGGSYFTGSSSLDVYDPKTLATEQNVIVASLQYRVASLGFLYLGTDDAPGNQGLLDQRMALRWIKNNVHQFGGNPNSITLFSESAGSNSVAYHLLSPGSRPLFDRAILQSAGATNPWGMITKKEARLRSMRLAEVLDCPHDNVNETMAYTAECLREVSDPMTLVNKEWDGVVFGIMGIPFPPVLDGDFATDSPARALARRNFKRTQVLLGVNKEEGHYFILYYLSDLLKRQENVSLTREQFEGAVRELNMFVNPVGIHAIIHEYIDWQRPNNSEMLLNALDKMVGDYQFICPTLEFAQSYAATKNDVYLYYFNHHSSQSLWPKWMGVLHGDEIFYVFGEPLNKTHFRYTKEEVQLSKTMMTYWANFAKTGNPNTFSNGSWTPTYWPIHTERNKEFLMLSTNNLTTGRGHRARKCAFWKHYLPKLLAASRPPPVTKCEPELCMKTEDGELATCKKQRQEAASKKPKGYSIFEHVPPSYSAGRKKSLIKSSAGTIQESSHHVLTITLTLTALTIVAGAAAAAGS